MSLRLRLGNTFVILPTSLEHIPVILVRVTRLIVGNVPGVDLIIIRCCRVLDTVKSCPTWDIYGIATAVATLTCRCNYLMVQCLVTETPVYPVALTIRASALCKHTIMCQNGTRIDPTPLVSGRVWHDCDISYGMFAGLNVDQLSFCRYSCTPSTAPGAFQTWFNYMLSICPHGPASDWLFTKLSICTRVTAKRLLWW